MLPSERPLAFSGSGLRYAVWVFQLVHSPGKLLHLVLRFLGYPLHSLQAIHQRWRIRIHYAFWKRDMTLRGNLIEEAALVLARIRKSGRRLGVGLSDSTESDRAGIPLRKPGPAGRIGVRRRGQLIERVDD